MNQTNEKNVEELVRQVTNALKENEQFYRTAANNLTSGKLHELFQERAEQRATFARRVASYANLKTEDAESADLMDFLHRGILTMKAAMTIESDKTDNVVIADSLAAEKKLLRVYEHVLVEETLPAGLEALLQRQYTSIQAAYSYIGTMFEGEDAPIVVSLFARLSDVRQAVTTLMDRGIPREQITIIAEKDVVEEALADNKAEMAKEGAGAGAVTGGALGGLIGLVAGTAITLTFGPILIIGIPALAGVTLAGTAIGASHGALAGALLGWGMGEDDVHGYIESVRRGQILLAARVEDEAAAESMIPLLQQANGERVAIRHESFTDVLQSPNS